MGRIKRYFNNAKNLVSYINDLSFSKDHTMYILCALRVYKQYLKKGLFSKEIKICFPDIPDYVDHINYKKFGNGNIKYKEVIWKYISKDDITRCIEACGLKILYDYKLPFKQIFVVE